MTRLLLAFCLALPSAAAAQDAAVFRPRHLIISGGLIAHGGVPVGDLTAILRPNVTTGPSFTVFRAESALRRAVGADLRVGIALTRRLAIELGGAYARPQLEITISGDAEADGGATIRERVSHYTAEVSGVYQLPWAGFESRMRPYIIGGGGYLRELHEDRLLAETGRTIHAGGGVHYWLRGGNGRGRALGARAEARFVHRSGGVEFEDKGRTYPAFSVLAFAGF